MRDHKTVGLPNSLVPIKLIEYWPFQTCQLSLSLTRHMHWKETSGSLFPKSKTFFIGVRPESIRLGTVGSYSFQVVIVKTLPTGLWRLCRKRAVTREGQSNSVEVIRNKIKCSCSSIDAGEESICTYNINKCCRHWCSPFRCPNGKKGWRVKEELTCWSVRDLLVAIWEQRGGCWGRREVPVGSHVLLSLWSYQGAWPRGGPAVTLAALLMSSFRAHTHHFRRVKACFCS